jgi:hypothetical protein
MLPLPYHVAAIQEFARPPLIMELQAVLGMVGDGCHFLRSNKLVDFSTYDIEISCLAGVTVKYE